MASLLLNWYFRNEMSGLKNAGYEIWYGYCHQLTYLCSVAAQFEVWMDFTLPWSAPGSPAQPLSASRNMELVRRVWCLMGPDSTPTFARTSHPSFYVHMEISQQKYEVRVRGDECFFWKGRNVFLRFVPFHLKLWSLE